MRFLLIILLLIAAVGLTSAQTSGTLTVSTLTSQTSGGGYAPKNIMSIWIVDSNGKFVKSLLVYAATRKSYLYNWIASDVTKNTVDAITGATQSSHGTRVCTWNGKDISEVVVADGTYTVRMELTDKDAQGNLASFTFIKGPSSQTLTPAAVPSFANISIQWVPAPTALEDISFSNLYTVYPNPTGSTVFCNGLDIVKIELCNASGKTILTTNLQRIDLSNLPKGIYLARITAKGGTAVKKIEKL